jgi:hypothetical protein
MPMLRIFDIISFHLGKLIKSINFVDIDITRDIINYSEPK